MNATSTLAQGRVITPESGERPPCTVISMQMTVAFIF
jgi:hypothetical protein